MIRIAIVEDESLSSQLLSEMIHRYSSQKNASVDVSVFSDGDSFLEKKNDRFDLVFLDINMPGKNGMEVAKEFRRYQTETFLIFVTDLAQYAIKGYEVDAMDFLVKPVNYNHLSSRLDKIFRLIHEKSKDSKFQIRSSKGIVAVSPYEIRYVEVLEHTLIFHMGDELIYSSGSLNEMEKKLSSFDFVRCNNCYLVNLAFVTSISKYTLYIHDDTLSISRNRKKMFMEAFTEYLGKHN